MKILTIALVVSVLILAPAAFAQEPPSAQQTPSGQPSPGMTRPTHPAHPMPRGTGAADLDKAMRKLWEDHLTYTRNYIISALGNLGDTEQIAQRLMKNQEEIGNAIKPYYGDEAGRKLTSLLRGHIQIATEVVKEAKAGNKEQLDAAQNRWSANGREIAAFLSGANPNWSQNSLEQMLQKHLDLTTGEVVARLNKDWSADIRSYDQGHEHMLMFADTLARGIAQQFPDKVRDERASLATGQ